MSSKYRKPKSAAIEKELLDLGWELDKKNSLMIGDAENKSIDFSDSDLEFAKSIGIQFIHVDKLKI